MDDSDEMRENGGVRFYGGLVLLIPQKYAKNTKQAAKYTAVCAAKIAHLRAHFSATPHFQSKARRRSPSIDLASMVLELHIWGPAFGLPSIDPECLAVVVYLVQGFKPSDWVLIPTSDPSTNPTGKHLALSECVYETDESHQGACLHCDRIRWL